MAKYDFSGWATRHNIRCSDGRTITKDAFKHNDGKIVPLVWNHQHNDPSNVLGNALLHYYEDGVRCDCTFNDSPKALDAKEAVLHGDITGMSIFANRLQQRGGDVMHGEIIEVSLVYATANPGAFIDSVMSHSSETDFDQAIIYTGESISLCHSDEETEDKKEDTKEEPAKESKTIEQVIATMNEEQQEVVYGLLGRVMEGIDEDNDEGDEEETEDIKHSEGGDNTMKSNLFDRNNGQQHSEAVLSHSDQCAILDLAKASSVGRLSTAFEIFAEQNQLELQHGYEDIENLFPEFKDVRPGAPELLERDQGWVGVVMKKVHKSPINRIRTRQLDARAAEIRAKGYKKGEKKTLSADLKLLQRTTDPQTVYRKDELHRDDIIDITDFDVVEYQYTVMRHNMNEDLALAFLIGDGRDDLDADKIKEEHIRPIWTDEDLYTIHQDVDVEAARAELQGTNTAANFGENYIRAEATVSAAMYAREKYKGSGNLDYYCTPHSLNVMLLARDLNGRRIYNSKADLEAALNVNAIYTVEQFEGKTRIDKDGNEKKLVGIFVNLSDYTVGATKGGEITKFNQFDIDFNKEKFLLEARLSGALTKVFSAIALEEPVEAA